MVLPIRIYLDDFNMPAAMNSTLFWVAKPHYMEHLKTAAQEWEFYERQKAGLQRWCQVAEARRVRSRVKKIVSCRCL